jgi:hypothetical protein
MKGRSPLSFSSKMVQIPAWFSDEAVRASRQKRYSIAGSWRVASDSSLTATDLPSFWSSAS